jgi:hypothetical protein
VAPKLFSVGPGIQPSVLGTVKEDLTYQEIDDQDGSGKESETSAEVLSIIDGKIDANGIRAQFLDEDETGPFIRSQLSPENI